MAGIDKTYIDGKDYKHYRTWWIDNYYKMKRELGYAVWLYPFSFFDNAPEEMTPEFLLNNTSDLEYYKNRYDFPIWNTSESCDKWLLNNCNIQSFRNRMLEVYNPKWEGFRGQKWVPKANFKLKCKK